MAYFMGKTAISGLAFAGVDDGDLGAVCQHQHASVPRLPAAHRVKHRAVQHDALGRHGHHRGSAFGQIGVLAEEVLGHAAHLRPCAAWSSTR